MKIQESSVPDDGRQFLACGTCLRLREPEGSGLCPLSTMKDQDAIICDSDWVVTF